MRIPKFNCKLEEIIPIVELIWLSVVRDRSKFEAFATMYNEDFFISNEDAIEALKILLQPQVMKAETKKMTQVVNKMMTDFRPKLNALESYVRKAAGSLTAAPADFGFKAVRKAISARNKEGVIDLMRVLLQLVERNAEVIAVKGFSAEAKAELETAFNTLDTQCLQKAEQIQNASKGIKKYNLELKTLLAKMMAVCNDGKIIFATTEREKIKDYTFTQLLKLVRGHGGGSITPTP